MEPALPQAIGREWIARHIPHGGAMGLIDRVLAWDAGSIQCMTSTHTHANNPLRAENRLGALCGVEYAAQAVAIHGAILNCEGGPGQGPTHPMHGYLVALRDVDVRVERLDNLPEELEIVAVRVAALAGGASYRYVIRRGPETLQSGRLTLRFTAAAAQESGVRA